MAISRNQACPCGSGKKYKKCCMNKDKVIDIFKLQEERFYERKHELTTMITDFVWGKMDHREHKRLQTIFDTRTGQSVDKEAVPMMFHFFTLFIHRYENGHRGIEWFYKERKNHLNSDLKAMAKRWTNLKFYPVQATEIAADVIIFEDMITKEAYPVANTYGNVPSSIKQGDGTIGLLELNNEKYYFNGVKVFMASNNLIRAKHKIESLMKTTGMAYDAVMMEYTLEVLAVMLSGDKQHRYNNEDIAILEDLGLEHLPVYSGDFLAFFKEKTKGKKENTIRKYRESLQDLNEVLKRNHIVDLIEIEEKTWKSLLSKDYFDMFEVMTKTQITDFLSTFKAFLQWMKRNKKGMLWTGLADFIKEEESQFINAVQLPHTFFANRHGDFGLKMNELAKLLRGEIVIDSPKIAGLFEIVKRNKQSFRVILLSGSNKELEGKQYTISGSDVHMEYLEEGLLFTGEITKGRINMWELLEMEGGYPRTAKPFLIEELNKVEV
ncbi:SEC-C domain-containing protein [Sutcliffiella halmapala]|uniref:SEC-C domain-containing protein n=1 Tax=Sutcliffiella halmapala TaxID=79882 RepID=UPI000995D9E6|nr:SEC-C domain-containing protein [Sutcliffiella halmapala]